jgi:hypothetical protein
MIDMKELASGSVFVCLFCLGDKCHAGFSCGRQSIDPMLCYRILLVNIAHWWVPSQDTVTITPPLLRFICCCINMVVCLQTIFPEIYEITATTSPMFIFLSLQRFICLRDRAIACMSYCSEDKRLQKVMLFFIVHQVWIQMAISRTAILL